MSTVTRRLAGAVFEVRDLGSHLLKGIVEPVSAWQVVGLKGAEGRFEATRGGEQRLSAFVGREDELRLLASKWAQVREGEGQVVLLEGEPGIGKSRITQWLMADIGRERHYRLRYQCSPFHTQSAFHPVIEQIERAAGFCIDDPSDVRLDKLEALFGESRRQPSQTVALVGALLGVPGDVRYGSLNLTPQKQKQLTLKALTDHVVASATDAPVLLLLEDAHWVDPSTLESLALTVEAAKGARILVLITYRPEFKAPWTGDRHVSNVILQRLSTRQTRLLAESIAGERQLPDEIVEQIVQRTDGIPLFVEEMTKAVLESGLLKLDGSGRYRSNGSLGAIAVPTTLRDSLTARLDRLSPSKEVAQISACIGREFRYALLETVSGLPRHQLADALLRLESSELVLRHGEPPESVYTFKHALIQDAAYEGLIKGRRTQIHARIAEVLEADFPELAMAEPETLARHWTLADRPAQSVVYWLAAGEKAIRRVAFQEALRHLDCGIEAIRSSPPSRVRDDLEVALRAALAMAWMAHRGWQAEQVTAAATPALPLLKGSDRREARMRILVALRHNSMNRGRIREAAEWYRRMLEIGEQDDDAELLLEGHVGSMSVNYWLGEFAKSESSAAEVRSRYHPEQHWHVADVCNHDPLTLHGIWMSQCLWIRGFADQALKLCNEKDVHATRRNHPFDLGFALTAGALALDFARRPEEMLARVLQAKALGEEQSLPVISRVLAPLVEGLACLRSGQPREARGLLSRSMDAWTGGGAYIATPYIRAALAEAFALEGDNEEGLRLVEESIEQSDRAGWEERAHAAELIRIKGWILWRTARLDAAEVAYREALHMARRQGALSWELRGATQLAELLADTRRQAVARETLEPVLVRVVEGWDSPDVVRARAVLESVR
jgi:tetratricopeptide (TPR) repeat protein